MSEVGKRIKAARAYAGISSQETLGELLGGVSQSMIQRLESGDRGLKPYEQRTLLVGIADVCGLPAAWFTADFSRLDEIAVRQNPEDLVDDQHERRRQSPSGEGSSGTGSTGLGA